MPYANSLVPWQRASHCVRDSSMLMRLFISYANLPKGNREQSNLSRILNKHPINMSKLNFY